ncbi:hypothetical protein FXO38_18611 [Capsicum annuum]|nr:hypothetical protein FXO38_18611 [Capsicum annuum]KAF3682623.1 hypothetical protein FXO37_02237 [Capsicum annuum]
MSRVQMDSFPLAFRNGPMIPTFSSQVRSLNSRGRIEVQYPCGDEYVEPRPQSRRRGRRWEERPNYDKGEATGTQLIHVHDNVSSDRPSSSFRKHFSGIPVNTHASSSHYPSETSYNLNDTPLVLYQPECITHSTHLARHTCNDPRLPPSRYMVLTVPRNHKLTHELVPTVSTK